MADAIEKAKAGRINSKYTFEATNEEGVKTIEASVIVRDQDPTTASLALVGAVDGVMAPAKAQVEVAK